MNVYSKPHLSFEEQINLLKSRGLIFEDEGRAMNALQSLGYYRLTGYLYPYREKSMDGSPADSFRVGSSFDEVLSLIAFDRKFRMCLLDGLEMFELSLRAKLAYHSGKIDPFIHYKPELLSEKFSIRGVNKRRQTSNERQCTYEQWFDSYKKRKNESREPFIKWFNEEYQGKLPIWVAIEILQFGQISQLLRAMPLDVRSLVAKYFGFAEPSIFQSLVKSLNSIRNICAHHSRLWNRVLSSTARLPKENSIIQLEHLRLMPKEMNDKLYRSIAMLSWALSSQEESLVWSRQLSDVGRSFPKSSKISIQSIGFPENWESLELWQR